MPPTVLMASSTPWPAVLVGVAVVVAVCLWLLFRPGSMAHRARSDHPDDADLPVASKESEESGEPRESEALGHLGGTDDASPNDADQRPDGGR